MRAALASCGAVMLLGCQVLARAFKRPWGLREIGRQIEAIGYRSVLVVVLTAIFSSMVMTVQFSVQLARFGAKEYVGNVVAFSLTRELGPVLTALMVGGRVGAGITAELGSMSITEQLDAMRAMGSDPVKELAVPRVVACAIALPLLTVIANVLGVAGGMVIARLEADIGIWLFINSALRAVTLSDLVGGLIKSVVFGAAIALIACDRGLRTRGGGEAVGRSTTQTVVICAITTLVADFFLTELLLEADL